MRQRRRFCGRSSLLTPGSSFPLDKYQRQNQDPKDLLAGGLLQKLLRLLVRSKPGGPADGGPAVDAPTARTIVSLLSGLW